MWFNGIGNRWFAVQVAPRGEDIVASVLRNKGYSVYSPMGAANSRRAVKRSRMRQPLFPGYLFCKLNDAVFGLVVTTSKVVRVVGIGKRPTPIEDHEIEAIQRIVESGQQPEPCPFLDSGQRVRISSGPLAGLEGVVLRCGAKCQVVVSVSLLQRSIAVTVSRDWLVGI